MVLPYSTWEWLAPTVLLTFWLVVPIATIEIFLSGIHNEVKDNILRSKTTMKRLRSNVRVANELNESDEEDLGLELHGNEKKPFALLLCVESLSSKACEVITLSETNQKSLCVCFFAFPDEFNRYLVDEGR